MNRIKPLNFIFILVTVLFLSAFVNFASSATMQILDGSFSSGGQSTSTNFQINGAFSQISIGRSASAEIDLRAGWLYFPMINTPIISTTAGDGSVALTWTPAVGSLGWTVAGYDIGWSAVSGGPYTYINNGVATNYTKSGLSNGTSYYFIVSVLDALGNSITTSTEISASPVAPITPPDNGGGGGGGGGGGIPPSGDNASAIFKGRAYPLSDVSLLRDGQLAATTKSGPDAIFEISISNLSAGSYNFGVNSTDNLGNRSLTQTFPVTLTKNATISISGIFIAPTISIDKQVVKKGDNLAIFGRSVPNGQIVIAINSDNEIFANTATDNSGAYLYNLDTSPLEMGDHSAKSKSSINTEISPFGESALFKVGSQNISAKPAPKFLKGDLNSDGKVNLTDFSIGAYWYKRSLTGAIIQTEIDRLNGDGQINLADFSIIAYYWTG